MKPSATQLESLRDIAHSGSRVIAERFATPLVRNGWTQKVGEYLDRCTSTFRFDLVLTDEGKQLLESTTGHCSKCKCTTFTARADTLDNRHVSKQRCECGHYQWRHGRTLNA